MSMMYILTQFHNSNIPSFENQNENENEHREEKPQMKMKRNDAENS